MKNNPITIKIQSSRKLKWEIGIPSKSKVYYLFEYCDIKYHFAHMEANIGYKYNMIFLEIYNCHFLLIVIRIGIVFLKKFFNTLRQAKILRGERVFVIF